MDANLRLVVRDSADRRREHLPTVSEFTVLVLDGSEKAALEIILFVRDGDENLSTTLHRIHRGHSAYMARYYVLLYLFATRVTNWKIPLVQRGNRILGNGDEDEGNRSASGHFSARQYYRYYVFTRQN